MKYVQCRFNEKDSRVYTYHYDKDEAISPGDKVKVQTKDGFAIVTVAGLTSKPKFDTKPILERLER